MNVKQAEKQIKTAVLKSRKDGIEFLPGRKTS